jgi:hypothetical protein
MTCILIAIVENLARALGARQWRSRYLAMLMATIVSIGCGVDDIDRTYGKRRGAEGRASVNGTAVLAEMFRDAGHKVTTWSRLSPKLEEANVIVWAPDSFTPPSAEERDFLEDWLWNAAGRTLIYIGRDFDAASRYWLHVQPSAPPEQSLEVARRLADVQSEHAMRRAAIPVDESADWFHVRRDGQRRRVETVEGPWSEKIDASRLDIELAGRLEIPVDANVDTWLEDVDHPWDGPPSYEVLLSSNNDPIVVSLSLPEWESSQLIFVVNGSLLLNLPLVNHEHRKLAAKLIADCGQPAKAVFLESGADGLLILDDPDAAYPTGLEMFTVWPVGTIMMHLVIAGITLLIASFPIFGRPHSLEVASSSDFGQHVSAVGELLEKTRDWQYALSRLRYYNENVRRDSGTSHRNK